MDEIKSLEIKLKQKDKEISSLRNEVLKLTGFVRALGFHPHKERGVADCGFVSSRAKLCTCGGIATFAPYMYGDGWVAQCRRCGVRTVESRHPIEALKNWNADNLTEASLLSRHTLTKDNIDTQGALNLIGAIRSCAISDLMDAEKVNSYDNEIAQTAEWFIKDPKVIEDIKSGLYRRLMEEQKAKEANHDLY